MNLLRDQRGAAAMELALFTPIFAVMVAGVVDISNAYSRKLALEQGAQRAIERIMQTTGTTTVEDTVKAEAVCQVNGMNADGSCKASPISTSDVTVTYTLECTGASGTTSQASVDQTTYNAFTCPSGNSETRYVAVAITDRYTPMFPMHFSSYNTTDGTYHLSATAGMRTS